MQHRQVFGSTDALAAEIIDLTVAAAGTAIAARGRFCVALTGGSAAELVYPVLAQAPLPWQVVHVFFGDERCVPPTHTDSNYALAERTLLSRVPLAPTNVHRMRGELAPIDAAAEYEQALERVAGGVLDVVHLGMGPDGHICSLFPNHPLLQSERLVDALSDSPKPPPARVTLTLRALAAARALWFIVAGAAKADAVRAAVLDPACPLPAARASRDAREARWLLDAAAAAQLKG
ncbi:MAG: 6-phosphogluconolactonase [Deltaproteobacteria bacterium]|nr:6-phosphogluconolactonase [Deltaproteobacteria bacterium]